MLPLSRTRKVTDAHYAFCPTCPTWLGNQYWALSKSVAMHRNGTGHEPILFVVSETPQVYMDLDELDRPVLIPA